MFGRLLAFILFVGIGFSNLYGSRCGPDDVMYMKIATGSKSGTYIKIGRDIERFVAPDACVVLRAIPTRGSIDNVNRLLNEKYLGLAIVQSDVLGAYKELATQGDKRAKTVVKKLRLVKPLYTEEVHFIVRKDSNLNFIQDIEKAKINAGPIGSGTNMSTLLIYKEIFGHNIPMKNMTEYNYSTALKKLIDGKIDVVIMVGGQPVAKINDFKDKDKIRFLQYDEDSDLKVKSYLVTELKKESYSWLNKDITTIGIPSYLVTFYYGNSSKSQYHKNMKRAILNIAYYLNKNLPLLRRCGHQKWKEIKQENETPLKGWKYFDGILEQNKRYGRDELMNDIGNYPNGCSPMRRSMGLCR